MDYCNICNVIIINISWYIENTLNEIKLVIDEYMTEETNPPSLINGEISEDKNLIDEEDWNNGWSPV